MSDELSSELEVLLHDFPRERLQSILSALRLLVELPPEEIDAVTRYVQQTEQPLTPGLVARSLRDVLAYRVSALRPIEEPTGVIAQFEGVPIRRTWHEGEWYYSVVDVCEALTGSEHPRAYWSKLKKRLQEESGELLPVVAILATTENDEFPFWGKLKMQSPDGKFYSTDAANREQILRIIQSIPSPKAEPFKRWLARLAREYLEAQERPATQQPAGLAAYFGHQADVAAEDARAFFTDLVASTLAPDMIRRAEEATGVRLDEQPTISPREFFSLLQAIVGLIRKQWPELPSGTD